MVRAFYLWADDAVAELGGLAAVIDVDEEFCGSLPAPIPIITAAFLFEIAEGFEGVDGTLS